MYDYRTLEGKPKLKTNWCVENQMSKIYTRNIFYKFQEEVCPAVVSNTILLEDNDDTKVFKIGPSGDLLNKKTVFFFIKKMEM